jgi:hypothetical protein
MSATDPDISANIFYNGIYTVPAQVQSNNALTLAIPFSFSNLEPYSPIPEFTPFLTELDSNGNTLGSQYLSPITDAMAAVGDFGWAIFVAIPIPPLQSNTAAILLELSPTLNLDLDPFATSWSLSPTFGVILQQPTTALMQVGIQIDSVYQITSSEVQSVTANINFPASNSSSANTSQTGGTETPQGSGQKRDISVSVPINVTSNPTTPNNFLQANFVVALAFGGVFK